MTEIVAALIPVFLTIALGVVLRRMKVPGDAFWPPVETLVYFVLFPALLFRTLAMADLDAAAVAGMAGALLSGLLAMATLLAALRRLIGLGGPRYTSVFQGAIRWNGFVALAVVGALYGQEGATRAAVAFGSLVPLANMLSVLTLARHASQTPATVRIVAGLLVRNPLVLSVAAGIAVNAAGVPVPGPVLDTLKVLADAALTLGLLAVGANLSFANVRAESGLVVLTSALKLVVMPLLMFGLCRLFGVDEIGTAVAVICGAVPPATSAYILARQMGGDAVLMASIVTVATLLAAATLPLAVFLLR